VTGTPVVLEDLERDALAELVNIGVSRAAVSLRMMVGEQVFLSVPSVEVVSRSTAATLIREREAGPMVAVRQAFEGAFAGQALLIFPEENSLELVRAVVGDVVPAEEVPEMEQEALAETANVVLNSCLAMMANMLERPLTMSLPEVLRGEGASFFELGADAGPRAVVLFLYINFAIDEHNIRGYIAMLMDLPSIDALRALVRDFIAKVVGEE
jgi:chemotaxis protein CheC